MERSLLDKPMIKFAEVDWEKVLYITFIVLALATRLWALGDRVQSHDESIHTKYSWHLYTGQGFAHHPLMHGPFLFHITALSYFLFGDNDFSARVPVALMGTVIVAFPYLLRRWLGRKGALTTSFFLLISPSIAYYSRYIRHDIPVMLWALVAIFSFLSYLHDGHKRWLCFMAAGVSLMFASKEVSFIYSAIIGFFLVILAAAQVFRQRWHNENLKAWFLAFLTVVVVGLFAIGLAQIQRPQEELSTQLPLQEQSVALVWKIVRTGGGILAGVGLLAAVAFILAGKLRRVDIEFSTPWVFALLAIVAVCLFALGIDTRVGILLGDYSSELYLSQAWADWLAIWGRAVLWIAVLTAGIISLFRYLIYKGVNSIQFLLALLVVAVVVAGMLLRLISPIVSSYGSCIQEQEADPTTCMQQAVKYPAWPAGGTKVLGVQIDAHVMLTILPFAGGIFVGLAWFAITALRGNRAFDLAVLLGSLCLPFLSPVLMNLAGLRPMDYNPPTLYFTGAITIEVLLISVAVGIMWDVRRQMSGKPKYSWLIAAAVHYAIFILLFTTFLTNAYGIPSGLVGSLGYWLEQQEVERGSQPEYYYVIMVGLYEYLPLLLSLLATPVLGLSFLKLILPHRLHWIKRLSATKGVFLLFITWWAALSWIGYSVAGERMPWLTVHVALPMIVISGWLVGQMIEKTDWQRVRQSKAWLLALIAPPLVIAIAVLIGAIRDNPLHGHSLAQLQASGRFLNALIGILVCGTGLGYMIQRSGWPTAARVLLLTASLVPTFITIRTAWRFCYINYDYPTEFLVYAHAAPGVHEAVEEIEEISQYYGGGPYAIEVPYSSDASTMFHWQLRYYPPDYSFGESPSQDQLGLGGQDRLGAPVIVVGSAQWGVVDRYVGDRYIHKTYAYIWWPMQDYWNLNWERIRYAVVNPGMRAALWDIWYNRDFTRYDQETNKTHSLADWPLRGDFRLYIRRDVAAQVWGLSSEPAPEIETLDPYAEGWLDLTARQVIVGSAPNQLQKPRGIKIGPDGFLYVADTANNKVQKLTPAGEPVAFWSQNFFEPWDVAVAPDGSIYVADTWNHRIQHLDAEGSPLNVWGTHGQYLSGGDVGQSAFYGPRGIAIGANNWVYVADTGNKRIQVFEPDGDFAFQWGGGGALAGYLDEPVGVAIGPRDEVYVADTWNRRIQVFTSAGVFLRQWPIEGWDARLVAEKGDLMHEEKPYLAVDADGYVYVTDPSNYRVLVFDEQGNYILSFGKYGFDGSSFALPNGIAVAEDGTIYVSDAHSNRILVFDPLNVSGKETSSEREPPTLEYPAAGAEMPSGPVPLLGTGSPGAQVQVLVDGQLVETVEIDDAGFWFTIIELAKPGTLTITLRSTTQQGDVVLSEPVKLIIVEE
ncbi:MAG: TIGR03663 family protein [Anaerolineae bacterium]|nr:TIGR03663 family protein [Anaerolineae bacterium]